MKNKQLNFNIYHKRKLVNLFYLIMSFVMMLIGIILVAWILFDTTYNGIANLSLQVFTEYTPPPEEMGGLLNAIYGSLIMVIGATIIGSIIGIIVGIYLAEYTNKNDLLGNIIKFINDILLSAPSIIIGLFIYVIMVVPRGGFSGWAGIWALTIIQIPIVIRTTETMLSLIPNNLREASFALGLPKWRVILNITTKAARPGIITGILLAIARISGETAPLLFTSLSNQFWNTDLDKPMASLTVTIFQFAMSPFENWQRLAWVGIFLITINVLILNIVAKFLTRNKTY